MSFTNVKKTRTRDTYPLTSKIYLLPFLTVPLSNCSKLKQTNNNNKCPDARLGMALMANDLN